MVIVEMFFAMRLKHFNMKQEPRARWRAYQNISYDFRLILPMLILIGIGLLMIYSATSTIALNRYHNDAYYLIKQTIWAGIGLICMVIARKIPYDMDRFWVYALILLALLLLIAVKFTPFGASAGGATRWFKIGWLKFQPSELARFSMVIFLACSLSRKADQAESFWIGFLPHVIILGIFAGLILLQPDFGSAAILCLLTWIIMFLGGVRLSHLMLPLIVVIPVGIRYMISASYRMDRIKAFFDPWAYASSYGYQPTHSQMAFGTGGLVGTGIGNSFQKLYYLPEPHTDFILSVAGEELGLIGILFILAMYAAIIWNGISIALNAPDRRGALLAAGLTAAIAIQVFINMGVALCLFPTKGLPLPFMSYGGTSLLFSMAGIGILINIATTRR
jgi:cell division protein FtsW